MGPAFEKLKAEAWALEKPPSRKFIAPVSGTLLLPKNLNSTKGYDNVSASHLGVALYWMVAPQDSLQAGR